MEEAPTPSKPETKIEPEGQIEHMKKFEAIYKEDNKYEISIYKRGIHFIIETEIIKDSQKIKYSNYYDLNSLKQTNKFLALCENIDDIIDTIYENALNFSCNIVENYNYYELKIPVPVKSIKEISFILKERKKTQNEIINELSSKYNLQDKIINEQNKNIEEQNKKIEEQNKKIEEQSKKIDEQNNKIKELENKIKNLERYNKELKNEIKEALKKEIINELKFEKEKEIIKIKANEINPIINSQSNIINFDSFKQLNNWINPLKSLKFDLLFTASINGDTFKNFHKYCDGKGPTVTVVKGENGYIFGGYVTVPFSSDNKSHYDDKAFLFSLTNMKKFPIKMKEYAVNHQSVLGPYIGYPDHCDLAIFSGCLSNKYSYSNPKSYEFNRVDLIGTSEKNFGVKDYEVYLVN